MTSFLHRIFLLIALISLAGCAAQPPIRATPVRVAIPEGGVAVPMSASRLGPPYVEVKVDGRPTDLIIDTGAYATLISPALADRAGAKVRRTQLRSVDAGGNVRRPRGIARLGSIDLGNASFVDVEAVVQDVSVLASAGDPISGAIGTPLFRDALVTLDYPNAKLVIEEGSLPDPNGQDVLPLRVGPLGRPLVEMKIGEKTVWVLLDTGYDGGLSLPDSARKLYPGAEKAYPGPSFAYYHGHGQGDRARLTDDLHIGWHVVRQPIVDLGIGRDPIIGGDYLRHFAITLDQRNGRVRFTRKDITPIRVPSIYGPGYYVERQSGKVIAVLPRSGAARAGLKVGDRLSSIDGMPYARFRDLREHIVLQQNTVSLIYERNGRLFPLVVPITVLLP